MSKDNIYINDLVASYFKARHFQNIPTDTSTVSMFATYQKSSLYLINIIMLNDNYVYEPTLYKKYRETTKKQFEHIDSDKIVLLNIMIMDKPDVLYPHIDITPNLEEHFIDVHWIIDSRNKELIIPNKQMKSVLGLEKPIIELLHTGKHEIYEIQKVGQHEFVTFFLILINIIVWFLLEQNGGSTNINTLMKYGAINVDYIHETGQYWRLFTSMFLHIGIAHLCFNSFSLLIFGARLEKYVRWYHLLMIYLFSGVIGGLFSFGGSLITGTNIVAAGASGAIYGLLGSILVLSKAASRPLEGLSSYTLWLIFIFGIVFSVVSPNVDAFAHIGGFIGGLVISIPIVRARRRQLGGTSNEER